MQIFYLLLCALFFSLGDYLSSLAGQPGYRGALAIVGAVVGGIGYFVFAYLSRTTSLAALSGYVNGAVVLMSSVIFGYFIQRNRVSMMEWFWLAVILLGILGLGYTRSASSATPPNESTEAS
ncbi:MAG: hypothetical protein U0136_19475 [Bdellovibrionota bacterium]